VSVRTRGSLVVLGIVLALFSLELLLRMFFAAAVHPRTRGLVKSANIPVVDRLVPDARLGYRLNRMFPGHDTRGWRNASALQQADIVALGDSQTYGVNVSTEAAWPQRLGSILHRRVYQIAVPGYGPGNYLLLFGEALALRPRVLIAAYYLGNDIIDSYALAYHLGDFKNTGRDPLLDSLVSRDPKVRKSIERAETIDPDLLRWQYLACAAPQPVPDPRLQLVHGILMAPPLAPLVARAPAARRSERIPPDSFLQKSSVLYRIGRHSLSRVKHRVFPSSEIEDYGPPVCVHYHDQQMKTILTPGERLLALDKTDPRVVEGERISWLVYKSLDQRSRRAGVRFYVVITPTKESAFRARAFARYHNEPYLRDLWDAEAEARSSAQAFFKRNGINVIDALPALEVVITSGVNVYLETSDGHPTAPGYDAIAQAVAERLRHDGFVPGR
jgi:hypothetical protein